MIGQAVEASARQALFCNYLRNGDFTTTMDTGASGLQIDAEEQAKITPHRQCCKIGKRVSKSSHSVATDRRLCQLSLATRAQQDVQVDPTLFKMDQNLAWLYCLPGRDKDGFNYSGRLSRDLDFHLHGVENQKKFVVLYLLSGIRVQPRHYASERTTAHLGLING